MKPLTKSAREAIAAYDLAVYRSTGGNNRTRFYKWLVPVPNDMEVRTVALRMRKDGSAAVKEVVRARAGSPRFTVIDLAFHFMGGYTVDWLGEFGPARGFGYDGEWGIEKYNAKSPMWKLHCAVVNPEALRESERFQWCAWTPSCGDILDYLKTYTAHPRIELLAKCGVGRLSRLPSIVRRLERDKAFMRFFSQNIAEVSAKGYGADVLTKAYASGMTLAEAVDAIRDRRRFRDCGGLPSTVDATRAIAYIDGRKGLTDAGYCLYAENCVKAGLDLSDTKNAFPLKFRERARIVSDKVNRQKDAEVLAAARKFMTLEDVNGPFTVRLPKSVNDFSFEGEKLDHCIGNGNYAAKMVRGESVIVFIRDAANPGKPFVTVEYDTATFLVKQCYGVNNSKPPKQVLDFVHGSFLKAITRLQVAAAKGKMTQSKRATA